MESWRNWLAQESYTLKVGSSSLSLSTMKQEIEEINKGVIGIDCYGET